MYLLVKRSVRGSGSMDFVGPCISLYTEGACKADRNDSNTRVVFCHVIIDQIYIPREEKGV